MIYNPAINKRSFTQKQKPIAIITERMPGKAIGYVFSGIPKMSKWKRPQTDTSSSSRYPKAFKKLNFIGSLSDGWNDNKAKAFSESLLAKAQIVLNSLGKEPDVFPTACDAVQFEYEKANGEYLELEIFADHISLYYIDAEGKEENYDFSETEQAISKTNMILKAMYGYVGVCGKKSA